MTVGVSSSSSSTDSIVLDPMEANAALKKQLEASMSGGKRRMGLPITFQVRCESLLQYVPCSPPSQPLHPTIALHHCTTEPDIHGGQHGKQKGKVGTAGQRQWFFQAWRARSPDGTKRYAVVECKGWSVRVCVVCTVIHTVIHILHTFPTLSPPGSGKTTCLDILSGRKTAGKIEGDIRFGGMKPTVAFYRRYTGYVEQFDTLIPTLTVEQMLLYTAGRWWWEMCTCTHHMHTPHTPTHTTHPNRTQASS